MIVCPSCRNYVGLSASGGLPPWCPKCGADLKGAPVGLPPQAPAPTPAAPIPTVQPVEEEYDPQLPPLQVPVVQVQPMPPTSSIQPPQSMAAQPRRRRDEYDDDDYAYSPERAAAEAAWNKARWECAGALFTLAGLSLLCGGVFGMIGANLKMDLPGIGANVAVIAASLIFMGLLYAGLGWWALYQPLPATLVAFVIYALDSFLYIAAMMKAGQVPGIFVRIAIAVALARAVSTASKAVKPSSPRRPRW